MKKLEILSKKIEVIKVNVEIVKIKLLIFLAIAIGSWVYAHKSQAILFAILWISFAINAFGVFTNLTRLGKLQNDLKELDYD